MSRIRDKGMSLVVKVGEMSNFKVVGMTVVIVGVMSRVKAWRISKV